MIDDVKAAREGLETACTPLKSNANKKAKKEKK